jgi:hypothetical protein
MLIDAARWLRESGLTVEDLTLACAADTGIDAILEVTTGDRSALCRVGQVPRTLHSAIGYRAPQEAMDEYLEMKATG